MKVLLFSVLFGLYCGSWSVPVPKESLSNSKDMCSLPPKEGPCRAYLEMWFYNVSSHQCEMFVYGGCEGNQNRFDQEKTCKRMCEESKNSLLSRSPRAVKMNDIERKKNEDDKAEIKVEEENVPMNDILKDFHTTIRRKRTTEEVNEDVEDIMNRGNKQDPVKGEKQDPVKAEKQDPVKAEKQDPVKAEKQDPVKAEKQDPIKADETGNNEKTGETADTVKAVRSKVPFYQGEKETSHFAAFFLSSIVAVFVAYAIYHNRQKIVAIVIEGRNPKKHRYRKLETNVEEAMPSMKKYVA